MKRFWSFALVACLLLALTPVDHGTTLDTGQQEVVALVAHTSALTQVPAIVATYHFDAAQDIATPAVNASTQVVRVSDVGTTDPPNANTGTGTASRDARPHGSGGYNVLKMPHARGA